MYKKQRGEKEFHSLNNVQFRKKNGTMALTNHRLVWHDDSETFSLMFDQISSLFCLVHH